MADDSSFLSPRLPRAAGGPYTTHALQTERSIFGDIVYDAAKPYMFMEAAFLHGATSLWNSAIELAKLPVGDKGDQILNSMKGDSEKTYGKIYGAAWENFYGENVNAIEWSGELASLFVPGSIALKGISLARKGMYGIPKILGVAENAREKYNVAARTAEKTYGLYTNVWSATHKAFLASAASAGVESLAVTSLSYAMLKDSRMFNDYTLKDLAWDSVMFAGIGTTFKVLGNYKGAWNSIKGYEKEFHAQNAYAAVSEEMGAGDNLVRLFQSRNGKTFTDRASENYFKASVEKQFSRLPGGARKELEPLFGTLAERAGEAGVADDVTRMLLGVKEISPVKITPTNVMYHGAAFEGKKFGEATEFFTTDLKVAQQYASNQVFGAGKASAGQALKPTVYQTTDPGLKLLDLRKADDRKVYEQIRERFNNLNRADPDALLPKLDSEGFIISNTGLPGYGKVEQLKKALVARGYAGMLVDEGSQGISKAVFNPGNRLTNVFPVNFAGDSNITAFLNLKTGAVLNQIVPSAGDVGLTFTGTTLRLGGAALKIEKLFNTEAFALSHAEADAGHILAVQVGQDPKMAARLFPTKISQVIPINGKNVKFSFAFSQNNLLQLEAAEAMAKELGVAPISDALGVRLAPLEDILKLAETAKDKLASAAIKRGYTLEEAENLVNSQLKEGKITAENAYGKMSLEEAIKPKHVQVKYDLSNFISREEQLARVAQEGMEQIHAAKVAETLGPVVGKYINLGPFVEAMHFRDTKLTDLTSNSGFSRFFSFAHGDETAVSAFLLQGGSLRRDFAIKLQSAWAPKLEIAGARLTSVADHTKLAFYLNEVAAQPGQFILKETAEGKTFLWDTLSDRAARAKLTGNEMPEVPKNLIPIFKEMQEGAGKQMMELNNAIYSAGKIGEPMAAGTLFAPPVSAPFKQYVRFPDGGIAVIGARSESELLTKLDQFKNQKRPGEIIGALEAKEIDKRRVLFGPDTFFEDMHAHIQLAKGGFVHEAAVGPGAWDRMLAFYNQAAEGLSVKTFQTYFEPQIRQLEQMQRRYDLLRQGGPKTSLPKKQPFLDAIGTLLDRSLKGDVPGWNFVNRAVGEVSAAGFEAVYNAPRGSSAAAGKIVKALSLGFWKDPAARELVDFTASKEAKELTDVWNKTFGLGADYTSVPEVLGLTRKLRPNVAQEVISSVNHALVIGQLGTDVLNTTVNLLSFAMTNVPELQTIQRKIISGELRDSAFGVVIPGSAAGLQEFSLMRAFGNSIRKFANPVARRAEWDKMVERGIVSATTLEYKLAEQELWKSFGALAKEGEAGVGAVRKAWNGMLGGAQKWLVEKPNEWMRFVSADMSEQLLRAGGVTNEAVLAARVGQIVKRTQHNFPFAQRPIAFSGPVGSAISLYQTFVFNTIQNLARYAGEGDKAALSAFLGIQGATFGLQSNPIFHAVNSRIASHENNVDRHDIYGALSNDKMGDFLLYGSASNLLHISLWGRGDLTPRSPVLLPTSIDSIPAVAQTMKASAAVYGMFRQQLSGGDVPFSQSLAIAVQHMGISRPMAGIAAALSGTVVDAGGNKIADAQPFELATLARVIGGRPFDEGKLLDESYRIAANKARDRQLVETVGQDIKAEIQGRGDLSAETLGNAITRYTRAGGQPREFGNWMRELTEKAERPVADRLLRKYDSDPDVSQWMDFLVREQ